MTEKNSNLTFLKRRDTSEILSAYIEKINKNQKLSSVSSRKISISKPDSTSEKNQVQNQSNPALSEISKDVSRLKRRRSAVTYPSTYRSLSSAWYPFRSRSSVKSVSSVSHPDPCCYGNDSRPRRRRSDWSAVESYIRQPNDCRQLSYSQRRIVKSLECVRYTELSGLFF